MRMVSQTIPWKFVPKHYLLPYLTSGQGARTTISPSLTRRFDLITRGIRTFSLDNVSSDKTIATVSKFKFLDGLPIWGHPWSSEVTKGNYERKFIIYLFVFCPWSWWNHHGIVEVRPFSLERDGRQSYPHQLYHQRPIGLVYFSPSR